MPYVRIILATALFATALLCGGAPARAGECFGMLSYTYDGGECTDTTGDTTQILIRAGDEAERLQLGMADRSRNHVIAPARAGGIGRASRGVDAKLYREVAMRLRVRYDGPTVFPREAAAKLAPASPAQEKRIERVLDADIYAYDHSPIAMRDYLDTMFIPGARTFFIEAAYRVYDGEEMPEDGTRGLLISALTNVGTRAPVTAMTEVAKERIREGLVVNGMQLTVLDAYFRKHHLHDDDATLRKAARQALVANLGIDPASTRMIDLVCRAMPMRGFSCAQQRRLMLTGHV